MKEEYPPLLEPSFHDVKSERLEVMFCAPFGNADRRQYLLQRLRVLMREVQDLGISYELWIDGSYATEKEDPNDIDILFVLDERELNELDAGGQAKGIARIRHSSTRRTGPRARPPGPARVLYLLSATRSGAAGVQTRAYAAAEAEAARSLRSHHP